MSCLALSLQPANGPDILLQTREWFPPSRALVALSAFRGTRHSFAKTQLHSADPASDSLGDDPLAASSGQVIVGAESRYRVVYRLVNSIYVLAVTTTDDSNNNVFECINIVNQAVSVIVTACRGVDVTPEKLGKKYVEVYMALDIVLRGVSSIRLAAMLSSMHGDGVAKMVHSAVLTESKIRGADSWGSMEPQSEEHKAGVESFSQAMFELPTEALDAGDEVAAALAVFQPVEEKELPKVEESEVEKDPFAASDRINKPEEMLMDGFKKDKDSGVSDVSKVLAGLEVTTLPPAAATESTHIGVEGFEGHYGGIEFSNDGSTLPEDFEGINDAWGGGLDASEFVGPKKVVKDQGLGGLELLETSEPPSSAAGAKGRAGDKIEDILVKKTEMKGPEMYIVEEISAEIRESLLARVGLKGMIYLKTVPPKSSSGDEETEFSFKIEGTEGVKRFAVLSSKLSSLGSGLFHVRTATSEEAIPIAKYSLQPHMTPLPLRVRLVKRLSGTLLSIMIQYVLNPELPAPLNNVTFVLKLPADPALLKVSPKAVLNRSERELKWHIDEIPIKGNPGRLRARMPLDIGEDDDGSDLEIVGYVKFSAQGSRSFSGITLRPASEGKTDFYETDHRLGSKGCKLVGCGSALPSIQISNDDLSKIVDTSDEWISVRTGIHNRRILSRKESLTALATEAAQKALQMAEVDPDDVDLVLLCTSTPEDLFGSAPQIQKALGCKNNPLAYDITAACSGFILGLVSAACYIRGGGFNNVLVIGADALSRYVDWKDRGSCILFGDAAAAVLVQSCDSEEDGLFAFDMHSDGEGQRHLKASIETDHELGSNGSILGHLPKGSSYSCIEMNGKEVFRFAVRVVPQSIELALKKAGLAASNIDWLLLHQANQRIIDAVATRLEVPPERVISNLANYGNTSAASIPLALDEAVRSGKVQPGHTIATAGFGAGLTWGSAVVRWG